MKLFISFAHKDIKIVKRLVKVLKNAGHDVWYDNALKAGQEWQQQLEAEIEACDVFVYVMTANSDWDTSEWCHWEFVTAVEHHKPILPLLMQKEDDTFKLPVVISRLQYADLTNGLDKNTIHKMLSDLDALVVTNSDDLPDKPSHPKGKPTDVMTTEKPARFNNIQKAVASIAGIIIFFVTIFGVLPEPTRNSVFVSMGLLAPTPTPTETIIPTITSIPTETLTPTDEPTATQPSTSTPRATPATPSIQTDEETVIRIGPSAFFETLTTWDGRPLDILGVSADGGWYRVLLRDGRRGWVITSQNVVEVRGDKSLIPTIVVTNTPTQSVTNTYTPTLSSTLTETPRLTETLQACIGTIVNSGSNATTLAIARTRPMSSASLAPNPIRVGSEFEIQSTQIDNIGSNWYQVDESTRLVWIPDQYMQLTGNCS